MRRTPLLQLWPQGFSITRAFRITEEKILSLYQADRMVGGMLHPTQDAPSQFCMIDEPLAQGFVSEFICDFLFRPAAPLLLDLMKERGYGRVASGSEITRYVARGGRSFSGLP